MTRSAVTLLFQSVTTGALLVMRKWSIVALVAVILAGVFFVFHRRQHAQQTIVDIGAMLTIRDHALEIMGVMPDTPAAKAGLHRGLIIQQIDGTDIAGKPLAH